MRVARVKVACYLRSGVPDAGTVSPARYCWKRLGWAGVAQPVEHLICNQRVGGSNPFASSNNFVKIRFNRAGGRAVSLRSQCGPLTERNALQKDLPDRLNAEIYRERRSTVRRILVATIRDGLNRPSSSLKVCAGPTCIPVPSTYEFTHRWVSG